ncbi:MAG: hypothetical protein IT210_05190 [Armatimonadetes bacterium]|nr:hypothetical protein [Armatimonadota bacterium]
MCRLILNEEDRNRGLKLLNVDVAFSTLQAHLAQGLGFAAFYTKYLKASDQ